VNPAQVIGEQVGEREDVGSNHGVAAFPIQGADSVFVRH
jgi:hypothetical protein